MNERVVTELIIDARGATAGQREFEQAMAKASAAANQSSTINSKIPQSLDRITEAYKRVAASIDPVSQAQFRHEREMIRSQNAINRAVMTGVTTEQEAARVISALRTKQMSEIASMRAAQAGVTGAGRGTSGNFNNSNAAFQIQDIAMMSMMGQAPMMTALQQGPQLAMAMQAGGGLKSLLAGLASLVSVPMLLTVGLTAATAAAIQYFTNMKSGSEDSDEALKKQNALIAAVAAKWGDALPALRAYNDERQRGADIKDALAGTQAAVQQQFVEERAAVAGLNFEIADVITTLQLLGGHGDDLLPLQQAFNTLQDRVAGSNATAADALKVQAQLNDLYRQTGIATIGEYADKVGELAANLGEAATASQKLKDESALLNVSLAKGDRLKSMDQVQAEFDAALGLARRMGDLPSSTAPSSTRVGASGSMTNENGVNVHRFLSDVAEYTEESAGYLDEISTGMPNYFDNLEETLKNDVTGSITRYLQQLIYAQELAAMSISDAVRTGFLTGQDTRDRNQYTISRNDPVQDYYAQRLASQTAANTAAGKTVTSSIAGQSALWDYYMGGATKGVSYAGAFADGGEFTVPGPRAGDRNYVGMHVNGGETISVRKAGESNQRPVVVNFYAAPGESEATMEQRARIAGRAVNMELARA